METVHIQKYIHTTPRKLRLLVEMVRTLSPDQALTSLRFSQKYAAKDLEQAIKTALANARVQGLQETYFKTIEINEGPKMRRFRAGTRGRVKPYKRRMAHIKIVLTDNLNLNPERSRRVDDEQSRTIKPQNSNVKAEELKEQNSEKKGRAGQSGNAPKSKTGGRTGLSK